MRRPSPSLYNNEPICTLSLWCAAVFHPVPVGARSSRLSQPPQFARRRAYFPLAVKRNCLTASSAFFSASLRRCHACDVSPCPPFFFTAMSSKAGGSDGFNNAFPRNDYWARDKRHKVNKWDRIKAKLAAAQSSANTFIGLDVFTCLSAQSSRLKMKINSQQFLFILFIFTYAMSPTQFA